MKTFKRLTLAIVAITAVNLSSLQAAQPHMHAALNHLRAARAELERAEHNKGGWRLRALRNVDQAIADTENGIKTAK